MNAFLRLVLAAFAVAAFAAAASAQTSGIVNRLEVQRLAALNSPSAQLALADHFAALSERYTDEAARHRGMARAYGATSPRSAVNGAPAHCERLATIAEQSAAVTDELAMYYEALAEGVIMSAPTEASRFQSGEGAPEPTAADLRRLAKMARTRADHNALAEYYATVAVKNTAAANAHSAMARSYRAGVFKGLVDPAAHCDRQAAIARKAANDANWEAARERAFANIG